VPTSDQIPRPVDTLDDSQLVIAVIQGLVLVVSVMTAFRKARGYSCESAVTDGSKVDHMLNAGSNPDKAQAVFAAAIKHRPRIRPPIRQRMRVLEQWPVSAQ
jgi:hypothetical protein